MGIVVIKEIIGYFRQIILENASQGVVKRIRNKLYGKLQSLDCNFFDHTRTGDRVLKNINLSANAGDTIAIIDPTGSGKSTIINLLSRFYDPTYGTVYIDDINLKNIDLVAKQNLHNLLIKYANQSMYFYRKKKITNSIKK